MDNNNSLNLINSVDVGQARETLQKITQFQAVIKNTLRQDADFGIIPGTAKPTLLKPGAEKILMLMGLTSEYELTEKLQDYDNGVFAFTVKCTLTKNGVKITEGFGHCNTRESKYAYRWVYEKEVPAELDKGALVRRQFKGQYGEYFKYRLDNDDPFTLANTCLKMAKKRAQIDSVLTVASLSELFTQDIEDMDLGGDAVTQKPKETRQRATQPGTTDMDGLIDPDTGEIMGATPPPAKMGGNRQAAAASAPTGGELCEECGDAVAANVASYSRQFHNNRCLCRKCQPKRQAN